MLEKDEDIAEISEGYRLIQKIDGFRFGTDAVLLSDFFDGKKSGKILEIGTGNGIIPVLLFSKNKIERIKAVEIQRDNIELAKKNIELNRLSEKVELVCGDIKGLKEGNSYDYIISNPPYMVVDGKIKNLKESVSIARHEIKLNLVDFLEQSYRLLKPRGELYFVHKSYRVGEIFVELERVGFSPKKIRFVHYTEGKGASLVLVQASKGRKNILEIESPVFLR